ncbi:MAG: hypothetical protein Q9163_001352 [Psora crenata]
MSLEPGDSRSQRRLSLVAAKASNKDARPVITREVEKSPRPISKAGGAQLEASYILPASSSSGRHHDRHSSLTTVDRADFRDRDRTDRVYPGGRSSFHLPPPPKPTRDERDYAYDYTPPGEEVLRDLAPPPRPRRESYTTPRPTSMINLDRSTDIFARKDRDAPTPAPMRASENVGRADGVRQGTSARDDEYGRRHAAVRRYPRDDHDNGRFREPARSHIPPREDYVLYPEENLRHRRPRKPTLEDGKPPQKLRDSLGEGYAKDEDYPRRHHHRREHDHHREHDHREDYDDRHERDRGADYDERDRRLREEPRQRHNGHGEPDRNHGLMAGAATAGATSLAAEAARRNRHRDEDAHLSKDPPGHLRQLEQGPESTGNSGDTTQKDDHDDDDREERRRRRRREREREDRDYREAHEEAPLRARDPSVRVEDEQQLAIRPQNEETGRGQEPYERRSEATGEKPRRRRRHRHRSHHPHSQTSDSYSDPSSSDSGSSTDGPAQRPPRVVTPSTDPVDSTPRAPVKGILKPPRDKFPEEPPTIREGVAPLDAAKKGIPPEARWTKISRRLVNPEALEKEGVRFEDYPDHVIVLKVLSPEEISRYTKLTHEIREKRRLGEGDGASGSGSGSVITGAGGSGVGLNEGGP